jgi:site-specific DNA recombinase
VSKDDGGNGGRNLDGQLDLCRKHAEEQGWIVAAELAEDERGASGAALDLPQLNRVIEMAQAGEYDILVTREMDRLSRSLAKQLLIEEQLKRAGVQIAYVIGAYPDTLEGTLSKHIRAAIAEYERLKIRERTVRAKRLKVKSGKILLHGNRPPYGYRVSTDGNNLMVFEPEAEIVRLIFRWYVQGDETGRRLGTRSIAQRLTKMGVLTWYDTRPGGNKKAKPGEWSTGTVARYLASETYIGRWYYGRVNAGADKAARGINDQSQWIPLAVPTIISQDIWDNAQELRKENKMKAPRTLKHEYLLRQRLHCGQCGRRMRSRTLKAGKHRPTSYRYYVCMRNDTLHEEQKCQAPQYNADQIDGAVWAWIRSILSDPRALEEGLRLCQSRQSEASKPLQDRLHVVNDLIDGNRTQLERLLDLYLVGEIPRDMLDERRSRLNQTIKALEGEAAALALRLRSQTLTDDQIASLQDFAAQISEGLDEAEVDFATRLRIVNELEVEATLAIEEGEKVIHARCNLKEEVLSTVTPTSSDTAPCTPTPPRRRPAPARAIRPTGC